MIKRKNKKNDTPSVEPRYPGIQTAMDGSAAVVEMETAGGEAAGAYPITPSTQMGEGWAAAVAAGITTLALDFATGAQGDALRDDPSDEDARDSGKSLQTAERVFLGVTVAAAIAAGVLALFTDFGGDPVAVAPAVGGDAVGFAIAGRF